jgi:hypothetical protein
LLKNFKGVVMSKGFLKLLKGKGDKAVQEIVEDGQVLDSGTIGDTLQYSIYARGVIHIYSPNDGLLFKKDPDIFEEELRKIDFNSFKEGQEAKISGSGDNDDLVFKLADGKIELHLEKKGMGVIQKMREIISKGKKIMDDTPESPETPEA